MLPYLWLRWLLLVTIAAITSSSPFLDLDIWNNRAPDHEALQFFKEVFKDDEVKGYRRDTVANLPKSKSGRKKKGKNIRKKNVTETAYVRTGSDESGNVDAALEDIQPGLTLLTLTNNMLDGANFASDEAEDVEGTNSKRITAAFHDSEVPLPLPGGDLVLNEVSDCDILVVTLTPSDGLNFEKVHIMMKGEANFNGKENYKIPITIEKKVDSEVFEITEFQIADEITSMLPTITSGVDSLSSSFGSTFKQNWLNDLKNQLNDIEGFGAFDNEHLQLGFHLDEQNTVSHMIQAESIDLVIAQAGANTRWSFSAFVTFNDLGTKIRNLFSQTEHFDDNFLLRTITGQACVFLIGEEIEYLDPIKGDDKLSVCFGGQDEDVLANTKNIEAFSVIQPGLHAHLHVDFKETIKQGCYEQGEAVVGLDDVGVIRLYGKITSDGIDIQFLSPFAIDTRHLIRCVGSMFDNAPTALTSSNLILKDISRTKKADNTVHWTIAVDLTLSGGYATIPGTSIALENIAIAAEGDEHDASSWDFSGSLTASVGTASDITISINKEEGVYTLGISSTKFMLNDLLNAFTITQVSHDPESRNILNTLGIKDFSFSMTFGDDVEEHEFLVNGKPIIFGFDQLEIAAIIIKPNPNAASESHKKKTAIAHRRSPEGSNLKYTVGFYLDGADFTAVAKNLLGKTIDMQWLSGLKAVAVFTNEPENIILKASDSSSSKKKMKKHTKNVKGKKSKKAEGKRVKGHAKKSQTKALMTTNMEKKKEKENIAHKVLQKITRTTSVSGRGTSGTSGDDDDDDATDETADSGETEGRRELKFSNLDPLLVDKDIDFRITFGLIWTVPDNIESCAGNTVCTWMVENFKTTPKPSLCIMGEIGGGIFRLTAAIDLTVELIKKDDQILTFDRMSLELELGLTVPTIKIEAQMSYANMEINAWDENKLIFTGSLEASPSSLSLTFTMKGFIYPSFTSNKCPGLAYFAIGDIILGAGISGGMPSFVFGVAIKLGKMNISNGATDFPHIIEVKGYFGVDLAVASNNWVYGHINALTVNAVCTAYKLEAECSNIPTSVKNTGFPYGLTVSYSNVDREIEGMGITISAGLYIEGTLNLFGFECYCKLLVQDDGFTLEAKMSPLYWANGLLQVTRTDVDRDNGPIANISLTETQQQVYIEGYANILGIFTREIRIDVDETKFHLSFSGYIIPHLLSLDITICAVYGGEVESGDSALFSFSGTVQAGFSDQLKEAIRFFMESLREAACAAFEKAEAVVAAAQTKLSETQTTVAGWESKVRSWRDSLREKREDLENSMKPPPCNCPQVCFAFLDWKSKCWKIWGHWVGCPTWNSCFRMIDDIFCLAGCAIMKVVTTLVKWAKQAILALGELIAAGAEGLLRIAQGVLDLAQRVLDAASRVVQFIQASVDAILLAAQTVLNNMLDAFRLNQLTLSAKLTADYSACVGYEYDVTFFGSTYAGNGEACLDLNGFMSSLIGSILGGNSKTTGTMATRERLKEVETEEAEVESAKADLNAEESSVSSEISDETSETIEIPEEFRRENKAKLRSLADKLESIPRPATARTKEEMEISKLAKKKIPRYNPKVDPRVRSFVDKSPWKLPHLHVPVGHNATVSVDETVIGEKRSLDFGSNIGACRQMRLTLDGYSDLTDGIMTYLDSVKTSKVAMEKSKIAGKEKLNQFNNFIEEEAQKNNMSEVDRSDAYYVYNNLVDRHYELERKSSIAMHTEDLYALPIIRRQINALLGKEKGTNFMQFTNMMHSNAVEGYKRSQIPEPTIAQGEKILGNIKTELQSIVSEEDGALTTMLSRLTKVKRNIIAMNDAARKCRDN